MNIDSSGFPLIVVRWSPGPLPEEALERFILECNKVLARAEEQRQPYAMVSLGTGEISAKQRKRLASWLDGQDRLRRRWDLGTYVVVESAVTRVILTAMTWLTPSFSNVFSHTDEASAFAAARAALARGRGTDGTQPAKR